MARRDKATELYRMAADLSVPIRELARQADLLTRRMTPPNRAFVIHFAGVFRKHAKTEARKQAKEGR
jgi:hypothetical protein